MKEHGWKGDPIDVVRMKDGELTAIDNSRVAAARITGIEVKAVIHEYDEPLADRAQQERFTTPKGGIPATWGEAIKNRIGKQAAHFRSDNPNGSYNIEKMN